MAPRSMSPESFAVVPDFHHPGAIPTEQQQQRSSSNTSAMAPLTSAETELLNRTSPCSDTTPSPNGLRAQLSLGQVGQAALAPLQALSGTSTRRVSISERMTTSAKKTSARIAAGEASPMRRKGVKCLVTGESSGGKRPAVKSLTRKETEALKKMTTKHENEDFKSGLWRHVSDHPIWVNMVGLVDSYNGIEEPERVGVVAHIIGSQTFDNCATMAILLQAIFTAFSTNWALKNLGSEQTTMMWWIETFFLVFYTFEITLRLAVHRVYFFVSHDAKWNNFDLLLVLSSLTDAAVFYHYNSDSNESSNGNMSFWRIFRLLKLAKIMRTLRVMKVFKDLAVILESFVSSFTSLFWCFVMLAFIFYVFALLFVQGLTGFMQDAPEGIDERIKGEILTYFGSLDGAMVTLFMAVTGGDDWKQCFLVVRHAGLVYSMAFLFFIFFFTFAVVNVLTGVFVEKAVAAAAPDMEGRISDVRKQAMQNATELRGVLERMDVDQSGTISQAEFHFCMQNEYLVAYFASFGLEVRDAEMFFEMLSSIGGQDSHEVRLDDFVQGCLAMKGSATALDMQRQMCEILFLKRQMEEMLKAVNGNMSPRNSLRSELGAQPKLPRISASEAKAASGYAAAEALRSRSGSDEIPFSRLSSGSSSDASNNDEGAEPKLKLAASEAKAKRSRSGSNETATRSRSSSSSSDGSQGSDQHPKTATADFVPKFDTSVVDHRGLGRLELHSMLIELVPQIVAGVAESIAPIVSNLHTMVAPQYQHTSIPSSKPHSVATTTTTSIATHSIATTTRLLEVASPLAVVSASEHSTPCRSSEHSAPCRLLDRATIADDDCTPRTTASTHGLPERQNMQPADGKRTCDDVHEGLVLHSPAPQGEFYTSSNVMPCTVATIPSVQRHAMSEGASTSDAERHAMPEQQSRSLQVSPSQVEAKPQSEKLNESDVPSSVVGAEGPDDVRLSVSPTHQTMVQTTSLRSEEVQTIF